MLVAALNPCPCGFFGDPDHDCSCTGPQIQRYLNKISGPLPDRIDIHIEVPRTNIKDLESERPSESSTVIKERVRKARVLQQQRFEQEGIFCNAQMQSSHLKKYCKINTEAKQLMRDAFERLGLSARSIADLAGEDHILVKHIAEAFLYRRHRKLWA